MLLMCLLITVFRYDIERWEADGTLTKACISFSRDSTSSDCPRYVQDSISLYGSQVACLIHDCNASVSQSVTLLIIMLNWSHWICTATHVTGTPQHFISRFDSISYFISVSLLVLVTICLVKSCFFQFTALSQKMHQLWNGRARNYKNRFWWQLAKIFKRI